MLCFYTNGKKSIGVFYFHSPFQKYHMHSINNLIIKTTDRFNADMQKIKEIIEEEFNNAIDEIRNRPTGSEFLNKRARKIRNKKNEAKFLINIERLQIDFDKTKYKATTDAQHYGLIFDFSTDDATKIGTHIFVSNRPGIDLYIGKCDKHYELSASIGIEVIMHDIKYKQYETTVPYCGIFYMLKFDIYLNDWTIFAMYKYSKWPIIGRDNSFGVGISKKIG